MSAEALIIGGGPAGLMAAEVLADAGREVIIAEQTPTPARKFLMAGKSGLNLTKAEDADAFLTHFSGSAFGEGKLGMTDFAAAEVARWAGDLGVTLFTGSTGRVFPTGMKGSPLLRAWLQRLQGRGVEVRTRWRWQGFEDSGFSFDTPQGRILIEPAVTVLALGGASWPRLGSDAAWVPWLREEGVPVATLRPANMGFRVDWSPAMARHFGQAVKGVAIHAGQRQSRGEWVVTKTGIEGGGVYEIAATIRDGAAPHADLAPDLTAADLSQRIARAPAKLSLGNRLRRVLGDPVRAALLMEWGQPLPKDAETLARLAKHLPMRLTGPMPLDRAISSAGGIEGAGLTPDLELKARPGVFAAGEMLDWEAPTGGYLLTACLASGRLAGQGALDYLRRAS